MRMFVERLLATRPHVMFCNKPAHTAYSSTESGLIVSPNFPSRIPHTDGSPTTCELKITACARCRIRLNFDGLQRNWLTRCLSTFQDTTAGCHQGLVDELMCLSMNIFPFIKFWVLPWCSVVGCVNKVTLCRAWLVLGWLIIIDGHNTSVS